MPWENAQPTNNPLSVIQHHIACGNLVICYSVSFVDLELKSKLKQYDMLMNIFTGIRDSCVGATG